MNDHQAYQKLIGNINHTMKYDGINRIYFLRHIVAKLRANNKAKVLRVCGTNGKGSTITMIEQVLIAGRVATGTFTSPYLLNPLEQIRINGKQITEQQFLIAQRTVKQTLQEMNIDFSKDVSEFESWFIIAVQAFIDADVEWMLLECGLGGQLDATNAIDHSEMSLFTRIGLDHFKLLGPDLKSIATTKVKMVRPHETVINYPDQRPIVNSILKSIVHSQQAQLVTTDEVKFEDVCFDHQKGQYRLKWSWKNKNIPLKLNLLGEGQLMNLKMVVKWWVRFNSTYDQKISLQALVSGIERTFILGRFSNYHGWILDGAHNRDAIQEFVSTTNHYFNCQPKIIVVGFLSDKEAQRCVLELQALNNVTFITTTPDNVDRQLPARDLNGYFKTVPSTNIDSNVVLNADTISKAYALANQIAPPHSIKMAVGSFYLVKGLLKNIKGM